VTQFGGDAEQYVSVLATMEYVNSGQPGMNEVVSEESVAFSVAGRSYQHFWYQFVTIANRNYDSVRGREAGADYRLNIHDEHSVHAFVVGAGSAEAHETLFAARWGDCPRVAGICDPYREYLPLGAFVRAFSEVLPENASVSDLPLLFTLSVKTLNNGVKTVQCLVHVTRSHIQLLRDPDVQWAALSCERPETSGTD
jgi:hypothetical protein